MATNADLVAAWKAEDTMNDRSRQAALLDAIVPDGLAGRKIVFGEAAFVTTGTTVEIPCYTKEGTDLTVIEAIVLLPKAAWAATELLYYDGVVTVNTGAGNNTTTITRLAGTTSALAFGFIIIGY